MAEPQHHQHPGAAEADGGEVAWFVERLAVSLTDTGLPRMAARVYAHVLVDDAERHAAGDLAEALRVSPAAVSVAVRELVQAGLLTKQREPGERVDTYRLPTHDVWSALVLYRTTRLASHEQVAAEGAALLGALRPGGRRMAEAQAFFAFQRRELPEVLERWREHRREMFGRRRGR